MKNIGFSCFAFLLLFCGGCTMTHYYPSVDGLVLDSHSGKPVRDAAVVGIYNAKHNSPKGEVTEHVFAMETRTDKEGKFLFKDKRIYFPKFSGAVFAEEPAFYIFAPGYEAFTGDTPLSHFDYMKTVLGKNTYRINARPILSIVRNGKSKIYRFRLSPLKTAKKRQQNLCYTDVDLDPTLIPYYSGLVRNETQVYGNKMTGYK